MSNPYTEGILFALDTMRDAIARSDELIAPEVLDSTCTVREALAGVETIIATIAGMTRTYVDVVNLPTADGGG